MVQAQVEFENNNAVISGDYLTKKQLGDDYEMKDYSEIGKEWYEQIEAWEEYVTGKTVDEILGLEYYERDESHKFVPAEEDIMSSVTITVEDYNEVIKKAWDNKKEVENLEKLGLGISVDPSSSSEGSVRINTTISAIGLDSEGKIAAAIIDTVQPSLELEENSFLETHDEVLTKKELGDDYGMVDYSEIGKEWYEQIEAWEEYVIGKTVDEILGLEYYERDESHQFVPAEEDIMSSVTITVESYNESLEEAQKNAK